MLTASVAYGQEEPQEQAESGDAQQEPVTPRLEKPPVLLEQLPVSLPKDTVFPAEQVPVILDLLVNEKGVVTEATVATTAFGGVSRRSFLSLSPLLSSLLQVK